MKLIIELPEGSKELIDENNWVADSLFDNVVRLALQHGIPYEERPQGKWKNISMGITYKYQCSLCGRTISTTPMFLAEYPFCHCGADMRGNEK